MHITLAQVLEKYSYNPETGVFTRLIGIPGASAGTVAGGKNKDGYICIQISGKKVYAHRLAWLITNGEWPSAQIDHINRDKSDNRIANLRIADQSGNTINRDIRSDNTSGVTGVSKFGNAGKWRARGHIAGRAVHIGVFADKDQATKAFHQFAIQNYGEFYKHAA